MAYSVPDPYRQAIRGSIKWWASVDATLGGAPVAGATGMRPTGGSITDTSRPGVRRTLRLELASSPGLFDALSPIGTELVVTVHVEYQNRTVVDIPMGVFDVDSETVSESGGGISLTAPDKWVRIKRAQFLQPVGSTPGITVVEQIVVLLQSALGGETVNVTATHPARIGSMVWERDREKAINDLAAEIGAWVYFDRDGVATVADVPYTGGSANWMVDAGAGGVLIDVDRERSRTETCNIVVVESSASEGALFPTMYVWDANPSSPTYAGPGSGSGEAPPALGTSGPFGLVPYFHDSPTLASAGMAVLTGQSLLARQVGLASQISLTQVPNWAMDAFDALDVLPNTARRTVIEGVAASGVPILNRISSGAVLERHIADTVTHPLTHGSGQQIQGRSTGGGFA